MLTNEQREWILTHDNKRKLERVLSLLLWKEKKITPQQYKESIDYYDQHSMVSLANKIFGQ